MSDASIVAAIREIVERYNQDHGTDSAHSRLMEISEILESEGEFEWRVNFQSFREEYEYVVYAETKEDAIAEAEVSAREDGWAGGGVITTTKLS